MESMQIVMLLRLFRIMSVLYIIAAKLESLNWKNILLILLICWSCSPNLKRSPYLSHSAYMQLVYNIFPLTTVEKAFISYNVFQKLYHLLL